MPNTDATQRSGLFTQRAEGFTLVRADRITAIAAVIAVTSFYVEGAGEHSGAVQSVLDLTIALSYLAAMAGPFINFPLTARRTALRVGEGHKLIPITTREGRDAHARQRRIISRAQIHVTIVVALLVLAAIAGLIADLVDVPAWLWALLFLGVMLSMLPAAARWNDESIKAALRNYTRVHGKCLGCGYDLRDHPARAGACPECARPFDKTPLTPLETEAETRKAKHQDRAPLQRLVGNVAPSMEPAKRIRVIGVGSALTTLTISLTAVTLMSPADMQQAVTSPVQTLAPPIINYVAIMTLVLPPMLILALSDTAHSDADIELPKLRERRHEYDDPAARLILPARIAACAAYFGFGVAGFSALPLMIGDTQQSSGGHLQGQILLVAAISGCVLSSAAGMTYALIQATTVKRRLNKQSDNQDSASESNSPATTLEP